MESKVRVAEVATTPFSHRGMMFNEFQLPSDKHIRRVAFLPEQGFPAYWCNYPNPANPKTTTKEEAAEWILAEYQKFLDCVHDWEAAGPIISACGLCNTTVAGRLSQADQDKLEVLKQKMADICEGADYPYRGHEYEESMSGTTRPM